MRFSLLDIALASQAGRGRAALAALLLSCLLAATAARAEPVDVELAFINDVSGSITADDYRLMTNGYASAFRDPELVALIQRGAVGAIAVSLTMYAERSSVVVDWMRISDAETAARFADAAARARRPSRSAVGVEDGLADAIDATVLRFDNAFDGARRVIDVVTEGAESVLCPSTPDCPPLQRARDRALSRGVSAINALFLNDRNIFGNTPRHRVQAIPYGRRNLVKGSGAFSVMVDGFADFAPAIRAKIEREIRSEAEPRRAPTIACCH